MVWNFSHFFCITSCPYRVEQQFECCAIDRCSRPYEVFDGDNLLFDYLFILYFPIEIFRLHLVWSHCDKVIVTDFVIRPGYCASRCYFSFFMNEKRIFMLIGAPSSDDYIIIIWYNYYVNADRSESTAISTTKIVATCYHFIDDRGFYFANQANESSWFVTKLTPNACG